MRKEKGKCNDQYPKVLTSLSTFPDSLYISSSNGLTLELVRMVLFHMAGAANSMNQNDRDGVRGGSPKHLIVLISSLDDSKL